MLNVKTGQNHWTLDIDPTNILEVITAGGPYAFDNNEQHVIGLFFNKRLHFMKLFVTVVNQIRHAVNTGLE